MANPVLVDVTRGSLVESQHKAAFAVALPSGEIVMRAGDTAQAIYPRSAIKGMQALPLVASGGIEKFGLTDAEIALICASHNGEPAHVATARSILAKAGLNENALECGAHWPRAEAGYALAATGRRPAAIHNNCSGKHSGMLALAVCLGIGPQGYVARSHQVQTSVASAIEVVFGRPMAQAPCATDGCSVPTWAIPLGDLASGFAKFSSGEGLTAEFANAAARIRKAVANAPFMVAGSDRFVTGVMEITGPRAFVKTGAEGVICAALPERNLGIAVKVDDGAARAAETVMAHLLAHFGTVDPGCGGFDRFLTAPLYNWNGIHTGDVRASDALVEILAGQSSVMMA